jgi:hypothetical protein
VDTTPVWFLTESTFLPDADRRLEQIGPHATFYFYFGLFVAQFAEVENHCYWMFHRNCGLDDDVSRALIGGENLAKVVRLLGTIFRKGDFTPEQKKEMQTIIDQINAISTLRHSLVHRGPMIGRDEIRIMNRLTAKSADAIEVVKLNISHVKDAIVDLSVICLRLEILQHPGLRNSLYRKHLEVVDAPWRYKHIEPSKLFQPPRKVDQ